MKEPVFQVISNAVYGVFSSRQKALFSPIFPLFFNPFKDIIPIMSFKCEGISLSYSLIYSFTAFLFFQKTLQTTVSNPLLFSFGKSGQRYIRCELLTWKPYVLRFSF